MIGFSLDIKENIIKNDASEPWGSFFQDNATPQMEGLEELHNNIMFYLAIILFAVSWMMVSIIINFKNKKISNKYVNQDTLVELIWATLPVLILILIALPSFKLLYLMDGVIDPALETYGECHEWYWNCQYPDFIDIEPEMMEQNVFMQWELVMADYVNIMQHYKGQTLRGVNISLDPNGPNNKLNVLTCWFKYYDPGAFLYYYPNYTTISDNFLHRASILSCKINNLPRG